MVEKYNWYGRYWCMVWQILVQLTYWLSLVGHRVPRVPTWSSAVPTEAAVHVPISDRYPVRWGQNNVNDHVIRPVKLEPQNPGILCFREANSCFFSRNSKCCNFYNFWSSVSGFWEDLERFWNVRIRCFTLCGGGSEKLSSPMLPGHPIGQAVLVQ